MPSPLKVPKDRFNLLGALPWLNSAVLEDTSVGRLVLCGALKPYGGQIEPVLKKLELFEAMCRRKGSKSPLWRILQNTAESSISSRLQELSSLPQEEMSSLVAYLLECRLIDVAVFLQLGLSPAGQLHRLSVPQPPKMYFKQAGDWPALVGRGLQLLRECDEDVPMLDPLEPPPDVASSIFISLLSRRDTIEGHKIMGNFQCVAAHLSLIFKGIVDLPSTLSDFKALVIEMCANHGLPAERWESFFDSMKTTQAFKLPLHLALSCSPVCLFLPSNLMTKDLNRLLLLQMWQGLGGPRPEYLQLVEAILWRALFESALGVVPLSIRLKAAFQELNSINFGAVGYPDREWLGASPSFCAALEKPRPRSPKSEMPEPRSTQPPVPQSSTSSNTKTAVSRQHETSSPPKTSTQEPRPMTRSQATGSKLSPDLVKTPSKTETRSPVASTPRGSAWRQPRGKTKGAKGKARAVLETGAAGEKQASDACPEANDDFGSEPRQTLAAQKRTISTLSTESPLDPQSTGVKSLKLEDGSRYLRVYETIDLTVEMVSPPVIDLTLEDDVEDGRFASPLITLWDASNFINYVPKFHHSQEAGWFSGLTRALRGCQPNQCPPHLEDTLPSMVTLLDSKIAKELPVGQAQDLLRDFTLVLVPESLQTLGFNSAALGHFCMLDKVIAIRDFSSSLIGDRMATGSLALLLRSAERHGKTLSAPDVPIPGEALPFPSLASDVHAWNMTIDQPWCGRHWELPRSAVRWAEISTLHAYRLMSISKNGFATQIEVKSGSQLLVICQPSPFNPHPISSIVTLEQLRNPYITDTKTLDFQAIHLQAGYTGVIGPMVPFMLLSTHHSVVQMSHFYASSTLLPSCIGFMHSALTIDSSSNQSQKAAQSLLSRLVHYFHLVYTGRDITYLASRDQFPHVPDILTSSGVIQLLSICNVFEIMNILVYSLSSLERHMLIEARRLCRRMISWMDARLDFTDREGSRLEVSTDLWKVYLAHQLNTLRAYNTSLEQRGLSVRDSHILQSKLDAYSRQDPVLRSCLQDFEGRSSAADDFGWPTHLQFTVDLRLPPGEFLGDVQGETEDDVEYFAT